MAIITIDKLKVLLPRAASIDAPTLNSAIIRAQSIIESSLCCDRPLEKQVFTEHYQINTPSQSCFIDNLPIDETAEIIIEARLGNKQTDRVIGLPLPIQPYVTVDQGGYDLNPLTGELSLFSYLHNPVYNAYGRTGGMNGLVFTELRVTYTGGYDFCDTTNREVERIQVNFASVLNYMLSAGGYYEGSGIKKKKVDKQYEVEYFDTASSSGANTFFSIPNSLLAPFYKYKPNTYDF